VIRHRLEALPGPVQGVFESPFGDQPMRGVHAVARDAVAGAKLSFVACLVSGGREGLPLTGIRSWRFASAGCRRQRVARTGSVRRTSCQREHEQAAGQPRN